MTGNNGDGIRDSETSCALKIASLARIVCCSFSTPTKQKVATPDVRDARGTSLLFQLCSNIFEEFPMKKVIAALVVALTVSTVVGCGGAAATTKPATPAK